MSYWILPIAAFLASGLTLFSGFGLGTLLMPVFALFFPVDVAVALTAIVHFLNNLFKLALLGKLANWRVVLHFGFPAFLASLAGAWLLGELSSLPSPWQYSLFGNVFRISPLNAVIAILMILFALWDLLPSLELVAFPSKFLPVGGILSGFLGGLSGHQGALRSAFLIKCGLSKESFIATGIAIACLVDVSRIAVYSLHFSRAGWGANHLLLILTTLSAFLGAFLGNRLLKKVTLRTVQWIVSVMLFGIALALGLGWI